MADIEAASRGLLAHLGSDPHRTTVLVTADTILVRNRNGSADGIPATWEGHPVTVRKRPNARATYRRRVAASPMVPGGPPQRPR